MGLERADRVKETTTTTGTGTVDLGGAVTGFQTFVSQITSGATVRYFIESEDLTEWEVGEGVFTDASPDTLSRDTIYASSNSGSAVNFSAGTKTVTLTIVAEDVKTQETPYKIVPSVASDDLTVAIKHIDGTDPTAARPIWKKIGDTFYPITSALSVTKAAGTNWCNAGSSELATKEIDYFVYLGYNATDGVVIGFSRIPYANQYDDFSTTSTDEDYCAISTITNAAAGDDYEVIGRFAATLSAGAGYTWTVPTFTTKNLIQRPIYESRWFDYVAQISAGSGTLTTTVLTSARAKIVDNHMFIKASIEITTNGTGATNVIVSTPFNASASFFATGTGREWNVTGDALQCIIESTLNEITIRSYDNTYPGGDGTKHIIGIDIEI